MLSIDIWCLLDIAKCKPNMWNIKAWLYRHLFHITLEYINISCNFTIFYIDTYIWNSLNIHNYDIMTYKKAQIEQNIYIKNINLKYVIVSNYITHMKIPDIIAENLSDFWVPVFPNFFFNCKFLLLTCICLFGNNGVKNLKLW